jgi:hypothetical protein
MGNTFFCFNSKQPEWFFTQVLNWIKSHGDFIQHTVQPIFDKAGLGFVDAKVRDLQNGKMNLLLCLVDCWNSNMIPAVLNHVAVIFTFSH